MSISANIQTFEMRISPVYKNLYLFHEYEYFLNMIVLKMMIFYKLCSIVSWFVQE